MTGRDDCTPAELKTPAWRLFSVSLDLESVAHLADIAEEIAGNINDHEEVDPRDRDKIVSLQVAIKLMLRKARREVDTITAELEEEAHEDIP